MTFFDLILRNVWSRKARSLGLAAAVAIAVMTVVTLDVTSNGLEQSAAAVISIGKANFTVVQKGQSDILSSTIDKGELAHIQATPGVASAVGVLVETERVNADNPVFIEIGINPGDLAAFGVAVVKGRPYAPTATNQVMLGWRAASNLGLTVGDHFKANGTTNTVVGIFSTETLTATPGECFLCRPSRATTGCPASSPSHSLGISPGFLQPPLPSESNTTYPS